MAMFLIRIRIVGVRDHIQQSWAQSAAKLGKVEEVMAIKDADARRQAVADYFAASQQQETMGFLMLAQLEEARKKSIGYAAASVNISGAVKETYLNTLHFEELRSLAQALDQHDLLLAVESPNERMIREVKTEKISKLNNMLTHIAAQKQADKQ